MTREKCIQGVISMKYSRPHTQSSIKWFKKPVTVSWNTNEIFYFFSSFLKIDINHIIDIIF